MVNAQREMGKDHDAKVQVWKKKVQENESACLLLQEIISKQLPQLAEDDMEVERTVDLEAEVLKQYQFYIPESLSYCCSVITPIQERYNKCQPSEEIIKEALAVLKGVGIPYYK